MCYIKTEICVLNPIQLAFVDESRLYKFRAAVQSRLIDLNLQMGSKYCFASFFLFKDERISRQYGYSARGTRPVVSVKMAIFKSRNGESGNGTRNGTRNEKSRNEKSRNL